MKSWQSSLSNTWEFDPHIDYKQTQINNSSKFKEGQWGVWSFIF